MTRISFVKDAPADFDAVRKHLKAAAEMVRAMDRDQLNDFRAKAHANVQDADDADLGASMLFHLAEWEDGYRDEWLINNFTGRTLID